MIHSTLALIKEEYRQGAALDNVARVASHHRIQNSPGIRGATSYIQTDLATQGLEGQILSYPARHGVMWWANASFPEWSCRHAELVLLEGGRRERLCSFADAKISLIQRSVPTPAGGLETKIVLVENGADPAAYEGLDVRGKLVFSRGEVPGIAALAVDKHGAAGIILDTMRDQPPVRDRFTLPDGRQYLSFWPDDFGRHNAFGFVITPRQGAALRAMFASGKTELSAYAVVDSQWYDGDLEIANVVIAGQTDEEVVGLAHVCHPEPSANDNASGCGALMEAAATLSRLVSSGRLPKPRRTIRFLWLAEFTGTNAYLANNEERLAKTVAAINLDMVGENQHLCGSTFFVEGHVRAQPGFGGDLAEAVLRQMVLPGAQPGRNRPSQPFRWAIAPFSGGSDHNVWGDPTVGITCPMLCQHPDRFYHTSEDTMDKVDPDMLGIAGVLAATYLYEAANATPAAGAWLADQMAVRFPGEAEGVIGSILKDLAGELAGLSSTVVGGGTEVTRAREAKVAKARQAIHCRVAFLAERKAADIESLLRLAGESEQFAVAREAAGRAVASTAEFMLDKAMRDLALVAGYRRPSELPAAWRPSDAPGYARASRIVPKRACRGPYMEIAREIPPGYADKLAAFRAAHGSVAVPANQLQYWADGHRTLAQVADLIQGETGFANIEALVDYYELMVMQGAFQGD